MIKNKQQESPRTALDYLRGIRPGKFKLLYGSNSASEGLSFYGPARGGGFDTDLDVRQGDEPEGGDIHVITKNLNLSAQQLRALPKIDFQSAQLMAFQVNNFIDRDEATLPDLREEIDRMCLIDLVNNQESLTDLEISYSYDSACRDEMGKEIGGHRFFYQFVTFPLTKQQVEGIVEVAENFYSPQGKRMRILRNLDNGIERFERSFLDEASSTLKIPDQGDIKVVGGECIKILDDTNRNHRGYSFLFPIEEHAKGLC